MSERTTNEGEILDRHAHSDYADLGALSWTALDTRAQQPDEILARQEEGLEGDALRRELFWSLLDYLLAESERDLDIEGAGRRALVLLKYLDICAVSVEARAGDREEAEHLCSVLCAEQEGRMLLKKILMHMLGEKQTAQSALSLGKRVVAMAHCISHGAVARYTQAELARAARESKTAMSKRQRKVFNEPIEAAGGVAKARHQQGLDQRAKSSEVQMGNTSRAKSLAKGKDQNQST